MASNTKKETILLVEDTKSIIDLINIALSEKGYSVSCATNGVQALKIAPKLLPSLILLDILMPEMDGYETCKRLKENGLTKNIPIIFMSALTQTFDKVKAFQLGGVDYVSKPIETEELLARVQTHLTISHLQKELESANKVLIENEKKLKTENANKDRFISIMAHDLKNPFNTLLGFSALLKENIHKYELDKIEKQAGFIHQSAVLIYRLLEDLLLWVRAQSGKLPFDPQNLNISSICTDVIQNVRIMANAKNITISESIEKEVIGYVDINMLKTVLRNLLTNAIKFTHNDGIVSIDIKKNNSSFTITISDNGIGIKPDRINSLFDITQIQTTIGTNQEIGSGLGLLLCKEFIEKHNGTIWVESEVGKGSKFMFTLPDYKI